MNVLDRILLYAGSIALLLMWFEGYHAVKESTPPSPFGGRPASKGILSRGGAEGGSAISIGLPEGIRIDPATGLLMASCRPTSKASSR